jgi:hypothetical protein
MGSGTASTPPRKISKLDVVAVVVMVPALMSRAEQRPVLVIRPIRQDAAETARPTNARVGEGFWGILDRVNLARREWPLSAALPRSLPLMWRVTRG